MNEYCMSCGIPWPECDIYCAICAAPPATACGACGGSGLTDPVDCDCSRRGSLNYSLCPHHPAPCPVCVVR